MIEHITTISGKKSVLKISKEVLDKMINVLKKDGVFFEEQFNLLLGVSEISNALITLIEEHSDLTNVRCGTSGKPGWEYFLINGDITSEKEISELYHSERICYAECGISIEEIN